MHYFPVVRAAASPVLDGPEKKKKKEKTSSFSFFWPVGPNQNGPMAQKRYSKE